MHYTLLDTEILRVGEQQIHIPEALTAIERLWQQASQLPRVDGQQLYEKGSAKLSGLEQAYKPIIRAAQDDDTLNEVQAGTMGAILYAQAKFSYACCNYSIGDIPFKIRKAGACCAMLRDAENLCFNFANSKRDELYVDDWLQLCLLAGEAVQQRAFINQDRILNSTKRALGVLARAQNNILGEALVREEGGELADCSPVYIGQLYELGSFVWLKMAVLVEPFNVEIAHDSYQTAFKCASVLADRFARDYPVTATERLAKTEEGLRRTSGTARYSRPIERIQP